MAPELRILNGTVTLQEVDSRAADQKFLSL